MTYYLKIISLQTEIQDHYVYPQATAAVPALNYICVYTWVH